MDIVKGSVVKSRAGRDKDTFLIVVECKEGAALVCDGKSRRLCSPKLKNFKHLAPTGTVIEIPETDKQLRKALSSFGGNTKED